MKTKYTINEDLYILCFVVALFIVLIGFFLSNLFGYLLIVTGSFFVVFLIIILQKLDKQQCLTKTDLRLVKFFGIYTMSIGIILFLGLLLSGFDMSDIFIVLGLSFTGGIIYFAGKDEEINVAICHKEK